MRGLELYTELRASEKCHMFIVKSGERLSSVGLHACKQEELTEYPDYISLDSKPTTLRVQTIMSQYDAVSTCKLHDVRPRIRHSHTAGHRSIFALTCSGMVIYQSEMLIDDA